MTCKDCISFSRCKEMYEVFGVYIDLENSAVCKHFKNKAGVVSKEAFEQVKWERDTAIKQLESFGVGFCEDKELVEVVRCKDCKLSSEPKTVSRYDLYCNDYDVYYCEKEQKIVHGTHYCSYGEKNKK